jgi:hypothetical protein
MRMNSSPIALRFASGSVIPDSASKKSADLLALALAHQAGVDVDACQLRSDRFVHEGSGDRRVDATRQSAQGAGVTDLGSDCRHLLVDD